MWWRLVWYLKFKIWTFWDIDLSWFIKTEGSTLAAGGLFETSCSSILSKTIAAFFLLLLYIKLGFSTCIMHLYNVAKAAFFIVFPLVWWVRWFRFAKNCWTSWLHPIWCQVPAMSIKSRKIRESSTNMTACCFARMIPQFGCQCAGGCQPSIWLVWWSFQHCRAGVEQVNILTGLSDCTEYKRMLVRKPSIAVNRSMMEFEWTLKYTHTDYTSTMFY